MHRLCDFAHHHSKSEALASTSRYRLKLTKLLVRLLSLLSSLHAPSSPVE